MNKLANSKAFTITNIHAILFFASAIALSSAYFTEYFLHYKPCFLCIIERYPYFLTLALSFLIWQNFVQNKIVKKILYCCILASFLFGSIVSGYHVGIENGFINEPSTCSLKMNNEIALSLEDLKKILQNPTKEEIPRCGKASFKIFGLSMVEINLLYSSVLFALALSIKKSIS